MKTKKMNLLYTFVVVTAEISTTVIFCNWFVLLSPLIKKADVLEINCSSLVSGGYVQYMLCTLSLCLVFDFSCNNQAQAKNSQKIFFVELEKASLA